MSTETLTQYRQTTDENNYVPQVQLVTKGEDGVTRVAKTNPATGALIVDAAVTIPPIVIPPISVDVPAALDIFKTTIIGQRNNQVEVNFKSAPSATLITNTFVAGGSVSYANGHAIYSTSTATSATAKAVSVLKTQYRPLHETYAAFTAAFTTPTSANSYQRIGLYDATDGFYIGYSGTTFGITKRVGGVDTFIPRTSFNSDLLNANVNSVFTRNGGPEAINLTTSNLFRIRFAWLGSANILFEVFSPDGSWVVFHNIKQPNSDVNPSIANPDLPVTLEIVKTSADATDLKMYTACWAAGSTSERETLTATLTDNTLATLNRSVITGVTTGGGGGYVNVKVNPSGALATEVSGTVSVSNFPATQAVTGPLTDTQLRALAVPVSVSNYPATQAVTGPLTDTQLRASAVPVSVSNLPATQAVTGPLTDTQLRASAVPVSVSNLPVTQAVTGPLTDTQLRASAVPVSVSGTVSVSNLPATQAVTGPLTDTQLRASAVSVSVSNFPATQAVTGPLTDTQLRASAVPVSVSGVATAANQTTGNSSLSSIDGKIPALDNSKQPVIPSMTSGGNLSVTTATVGTTWTAFASQSLKQLTVSNQSGVNIEFRQGGAGVGFIVPTGAFYTFFGLTNANQLEARRVDISNTQVSITARWEV